MKRCLKKQSGHGKPGAPKHRCDSLWQSVVDNNKPQSLIVRPVQKSIHNFRCRDMDGSQKKVGGKQRY